MRSYFLFCLICLFSAEVLYAETSNIRVIYVDSEIGDDKNPGTKESPIYSIEKAVEIIESKDNNIYIMKLNPGIYVLDKPVLISTQKDITDKRIVIEAGILPDEPSWTPEQMPVIISSSKKGDIPFEDAFNFVICFFIDVSHITFRGIKFPGYFYPNTRYIPIVRVNKEKTDLLVEQCMFVGDEHASPIQVGILAHGNEIKVDHCIFYNAKNSVVFWQDSGDSIKTGNSLTNCIIYGAYQSGVWTAWPDKDFVFENNIVTNCKHAWIKNVDNPTKYSANNSIIVNNKHYQALADNEGVLPKVFEIDENNIIKEGKISLRMIDKNIDAPLPIDYLHVIPGTPGYDMGAGLFKSRK